VRLSHTPARTSAVFDGPNLVSHAGLVPVMALAERAGLPCARDQADTSTEATTTSWHASEPPATTPSKASAPAAKHRKSTNQAPGTRLKLFI
jgi:hypothetical protein